jgi:hypothetical protein
MASASQVRIPSRTAEGKHTPRFIIEFLSGATGKWRRSMNESWTGYFATREAAQSSLTSGVHDFYGLTYRVRQK